jgi:hypothetical protein
MPLVTRWSRLPGGHEAGHFADVAGMVNMSMGSDNDEGGALAAPARPRRVWVQPQAQQPAQQPGLQPAPLSSTLPPVPEGRVDLE